MFNTKFHKTEISGFSFLVTGGAGFIGSNLVEYLLQYGAKKVRVLDNFATGNINNLYYFKDKPVFELIVGDIRNEKDCLKAVAGIDYIFHQAALGSVPRSINDPITTNEVNISGFLNMLVAARDAKVKRFVYAASSSTYGDSKNLPKVEDIIGKPLSPYAITKYVNELYADIFSNLYGLETIGLRYFNVFGKRQNPAGEYAAVIPKFISLFLKHESPVINGDGEISRDFTYIENVIQANILAALTDNKDALNTVYNVACGESNTLNQLVTFLKSFLVEYDAKIGKVNVEYIKPRLGDIQYSLADINKAKTLLNYNPLFNFQDGLKQTVEWFYKENEV